MKTLLLITALFCALHGYSQNYAIGHTTINFQDPERGNRQIETEIYYPATSSGNNTNALSGEYPVIVFGHGFVMAWSAYENLWNEFVPRGYIMVFPRTEGNLLSTDHQQFGWDLEFLVTAMQQQGSDQNSILYNVVAPETALMGHSMGGGAAFLAADSLCNNGNTNLKTLVGLAPAESSSNGVSSIASATEVTVPSFILSGVQDGVTPAVDHHIPMYNNLASDCKTILHITGGAHCYFANSNFNCDFGEGTSSTGISISRQDQHDITFDFLNLWFDFTLKADCNDFSVFNDSLNSTPRATYDQVCSGPITFESTETVAICSGDSYLFPDGTVGTTSVIHTSSLSSIGGCDSIIETTLTVQPSYQLTESATICNGGAYTFPDGSTSSTSTVQSSVLTSITGCDSIIETTLTVQPSYQLTESATICNGDTYTFPDGSTSSASTVQSSVLTSITGCDSIIETTLTVQPSYQLTESATICNGGAYTFPDGSTSSTSTVQSSVLTSITGCDSIIETTLTVQPSYQLTESATICSGDTYTFPDGTIGSSETVHTSNLISVSGCDSIVETTLNVTSLNLGVSNSSGVLTADESGASYQWIDCDNSSAINGETSQSFTPSLTGDYAVEVTQNGCTGMSDCYEVQVSGLEIFENVPGIEIFPNPSNGHITINSELVGVIKLFDVTGKLIEEIRLEKGTKSILLDVASGIYSWKFESTDAHLYFGKVVVEKP